MTSDSAATARPAQDPGPTAADRPARPNSIGVSIYSFWQFREGAPRVTFAECIDKAAALGFDGVEILHVQMQDKSNASLQKIKRHAHSLGLALMGLSTHQGFVTPNPQERHTTVQKTLYQFEGNEDAATGVPKSLEMLRKNFGQADGPLPRALQS